MIRRLIKSLFILLLVVGCDDDKEVTKSRFIGEWNLIYVSCKENTEPWCPSDDLDDDFPALTNGS